MASRFLDYHFLLIPPKYKKVLVWGVPYSRVLYLWGAPNSQVLYLNSQPRSDSSVAELRYYRQMVPVKEQCSLNHWTNLLHFWGHIKGYFEGVGEFVWNTYFFNLPVRCFLFTAAVPVRCSFFTGTVPVICFLFTGTVPVNNLFLKFLTSQALPQQPPHF